jgi:hypothetical protein
MSYDVFVVSTDGRMEALMARMPEPDIGRL